MTNAGFFPDAISSDLHTHSMNARLKDMTNLMSEFLALGMTVEQVVTANTLNAAKAIKQEQLGNLSVDRGPISPSCEWRKGLSASSIKTRAAERHSAVDL